LYLPKGYEKKGIPVQLRFGPGHLRCFDYLDKSPLGILEQIPMENVDIQSQFPEICTPLRASSTCRMTVYLWIQTSMLSEEVSECLKPDKSSLAKCLEIGHPLQLGDLHLPFHMGQKTISIQITETV
jgi:hypothetical protein